MDIIVGVDGDGRFFAHTFDDHAGLQKTLFEKVEDGDTWANAFGRNPMYKNEMFPPNQSKQQIIDFLNEYEFIGRGRLEIINLKLNTE